MVVEPIQKNNIKIKLSNTESVGQNIFKYTSFDKVKETKSKSSTCNYFLTTNGKLAKELMEILNDFDKPFFLDVDKTKQCLLTENIIISDNNLKPDFKGDLSPFYTANDFFKYTNDKYLNLGNGRVKLDQGGKYNIYFDNNQSNVEMFRNSVIAVLCDINIDVVEDKYLIYPVIKDTLPFTSPSEDNLQKIIDLSKELEKGYNEEIIKEIILNGYELLNK